VPLIPDPRQNRGVILDCVYQKDSFPDLITVQSFDMSTVKINFCPSLTIPILPSNYWLNGML
jgi:hypothetical protein